MGYKVKWVEEHLGISRKALRNYERLGLMHQIKVENIEIIRMKILTVYGV